MRFPGIQSATEYFGSIEQVIRKLAKIRVPAALKVPLLVAGGITPAFVGSLLFESISPLFVVASIAVTYCLMRTIQGLLFEFCPKEKQWAITLPVHAMFLAWAAVLAVFNHAEQIGRSVGAMVIIVAVSIWPVYMGKRAYEKKKRKVSFKMAFAMTAIVVLIQQTLIMARHF
jgi:hypothetical protein